MLSQWDNSYNKCQRYRILFSHLWAISIWLAGWMSGFRHWFVFRPACTKSFMRNQWKYFFFVESKQRLDLWMTVISFHPNSVSSLIPVLHCKVRQEVESVWSGPGLISQEMHRKHKSCYSGLRKRHWLPSVQNALFWNVDMSYAFCDCKYDVWHSSEKDSSKPIDPPVKQTTSFFKIRCSINLSDDKRACLVEVVSTPKWKIDLRKFSERRCFFHAVHSDPACGWHPKLIISQYYVTCDRFHFEGKLI